MYLNGVVTEWETVAIPLTAGVDLNTRARLVEPTKLLAAKNVYFPRNGGLEKRKGHVSADVEYGEVAPHPTTETHLYGWGWIDIENPEAGARPDFPYAGNLRGIAQRDDETVVWDGSKLWTSDKTNGPLKAYMPTAKTFPVAKVATSQTYGDAGDNGVTRVVASLDADASMVRVFVYDSVTGALRFETSVGGANTAMLYVVPCGIRVHVFALDSAANVIYHVYARDGVNYISEQQELGIDVGVHFDVQKVAADMMLLAYVDTANQARFMYIRDTGEVDDILVAANTYFTGVNEALRIAIAKHPISEEVGVLWGTSTDQQRAKIYSYDGIPLSSNLVFANDTDNKKVALTTNYTVDANGRGTFYGYSDVLGSGDEFVRMRSFMMTDELSGEGGGTGETSDVALRYNVYLASHAFRVGNVPFVFTCYVSDFQTTYFLMDERLYPVGKLEPGTAYHTTDAWTFSVNWSESLLDTYFNCALTYKQRVLEQDGVFHEFSTKFCELDFLPEFRRVQAGRSLYFPGEQLWMYDGRNLTEQGFHLAVENPAVVPGIIVGGAMTSGGEYNYRIYMCWKNAQGEEVRGPAILGEKVTLGGSDTGVTITIKTLPTCREDAYFLVYRQANTGTLWCLASERDPTNSNCPKNQLGVASVEFVDKVSDTDLIERELDPASAANYLHSFSAPACEVIAYGHDRVWVAGGSLTNGTILPSRFFFEDETPGFHLNLGYSVDRNASPFTAIGFLADYTVAFKNDRAYVITGDPADNTSQGDSLRNQKALSDVGCISHNSLAELTIGLTFQSEGGIRLITPGAAVVNIGLDVDTVTDYITDAVVDVPNRLVKFYQESSDALVFDYEGGQWTTWTLRTLSAVADKLVHGFAIWTQSDLYTDNGANYLYTARSANLGPVLGGFHRVRRIGGIGETDQNYLVTIRTYLDENESWSEEFDWDSSEDLNTSTWGSGTWGSGFWGDATGTLIFARDSIWRWRHRCAKQKCSCISVEIEYNGPDKGPVHTALILEIGRKTGLDRQMK